ncbi:hypothetical protein [Streptomyces xanthochromogenes]
MPAASVLARLLSLYCTALTTGDQPVLALVEEVRHQAEASKRGTRAEY